MFMHDFLLKNLSKTDIEKELKIIGYDSSYAFRAKEKFCYKNLKIFKLTCAQANIIKQLALSVGADCATNKNVITGKIDISDCILGGSYSQLYKIAEKLQSQPFGLKDLGTILKEKIQEPQIQKTKIIGILNITKDSFSDGGNYYTTHNAIEKLKELILEGADIIDIGAESTRPGAKEIPPQEQLERIIPILNYINSNNIQIPISIDTRSSIVAKEVINLGAAIINDVSGLEFDSEMADVIASNPNTRIVIQHSQGTPDIMQNAPRYENLMDEIFISLYNKIQKAINSGISKSRIIVDPGIGFGKTKEQNYEIINRWEELKTLGCPVLIGLSRKSLLNMPDAPNEEKDIYTMALNSILINQNINYIRVHNVAMHKKLINLL